MLGANKNQSIHEVLTQLNHLDKHRAYGGLSMIFGGDLKQLGTVVTVTSCFRSHIFTYRAGKRPIYFQNSTYSQVRQFYLPQALRI